jgi:hypothetical protein
LTHGNKFLNSERLIGIAAFPFKRCALRNF